MQLTATLYTLTNIPRKCTSGHMRECPDTQAVIKKNGQRKPWSHLLDT